MDEAIDAKAVLTILDQGRDDSGEVVQVFAKAEADPRGNIMRKRYTTPTVICIVRDMHERLSED